MGGFPTSVPVGDFNGDGIQDLVSGNNFTTNASVFLGTGTGGFGAGTAYAVGGNALSFSVGDFNGDGALDIVAGTASNSLAILLGNGRGGFGSATSFAAGSNPSSIVIGDFNGDGVQDLVSANSLTTNVSVLLGNTRDGINPILPFSLRTAADARQALAPIKNELDSLTRQRGTIGAFQSLLTAASNVLLSQTEQFRSAESRIRDADIAAESSNLIRTQILQRASAAVLAQANLQPQVALQLLR